MEFTSGLTSVRVKQSNLKSAVHGKMVRRRQQSDSGGQDGAHARQQLEAARQRCKVHKEVGICLQTEQKLHNDNRLRVE